MIAHGPDQRAEVRAYTDPLLARTGLAPLDVGLFAGWFVPDRFGLIERTMLSAMKAPIGDFRDPRAVEAWTKKLPLAAANH